MRRLITDLLDYSRAVAGNEEIKQADGAVALEVALQAVSALLVETGARVARMPLPRLAIDEASLTRVFQNLISNALHYRSERPPCIDVRCEVDQGYAQISVADNGIGIAPQHHRRIFKMFERLHTSDARPGTGVGLALCKRLIEGASGQIWLESEVGRGTTFFIRLQLTAAAALSRVGGT
jgi:signal transduction histidine kinase